MDGGGGGTTEDEQLNLFPVTQREIPSKRKPNSIRQYAAERQLKFLRLVMKLGAINAYDEEGRMRDATGNVSSNILPLINHALSPGRNVQGMADFVELLVRAGVKPDDVINVNVRDLLLRRQKSTFSLTENGEQPRMRSFAPENHNSREEQSPLEEREEREQNIEETSIHNDGVVTQRQPRRPRVPKLLTTTPTNEEEGVQTRAQKRKFSDGKEGDEIQSTTEPPLRKQKGSGKREPIKWFTIDDEN